MNWLEPRADVRVIAHRGSSHDAPENTLCAFALARQDGADGVELDVMRCRTGQVIVFHDNDLERLCGVVGDPRARSLAELRELSVQGEPIPELHEVIEVLGASMLLNVELKTAPEWRGRVDNDGLADEVARILGHHGLGERALVSSFDPVLLARFRRSAPTVVTGMLFAADQSAPLRRGWAAQVLGTRAVHPESVLVDEASVRSWHRRGLRVNVWTVDDPAEQRYLATIGVDGIITNRPRETRVMLRAAMGAVS
ncbi:MAG: glycerophosphodiester phosphodiesterase [Polyangia bacterium]